MSEKYNIIHQSFIQKTLINVENITQNKRIT